MNKLVVCFHNEYAEDKLRVGATYKVRSSNPKLGLIEVLCPDKTYRWFNINRFEEDDANATYWNSLRL